MPASAKESSTVGSVAPNATKIIVAARPSNTNGRCERVMRRTRNAPSEASAQLVKNSSASVSGGAPVPTETSICAGNAAAKYQGHLLNGTISSTASRIELGSHSTDCGALGDCSANPICAP